MKESMPISEQRLFAAVPTFFKSRKDHPDKGKWGHTPLDEEAIRKNINRMVMQGISPLIIGTTGESPTLEHDEERQLIAMARDEIDNNSKDSRAPLLVGAGSNSTREAVIYTISAIQDGADGILSVFPYYNKPTAEGQENHFSSILEEAVDTPVIIYNIPGRTGKTIDYSTLIALAKVFKNLKGVKECDASRMQYTVINDYDEQIGRSDFHTWTGEDPNIVDNMYCGVFGAISVLANVYPDLTDRLIKLCAEGDFKKAARLHAKLKKLIALLFKEGNPNGVKGALYLKGIGNNEGRSPIVGASPELLKEIEAELESIDRMFSQ
jgi:4-hydroxy-tetrahydrodipicolinate synthase